MLYFAHEIHSFADDIYIDRRILPAINSFECLYYVPIPILSVLHNGAALLVCVQFIGVVLTAIHKKQLNVL
jgi:hypothetical protein